MFFVLPAFVGRVKQKYKNPTCFDKLGAYQKGVKLVVFLKPSWSVRFMRALMFVYRCLFKRKLLALGSMWEISKLALHGREYSVLIYLTIFLSWFTTLYSLTYVYGWRTLNDIEITRVIIDAVKCFIGMD